MIKTIIKKTTVCKPGVRCEKWNNYCKKDIVGFSYL